jgi:hypothetical protein
VKNTLFILIVRNETPQNTVAIADGNNIIDGILGVILPNPYVNAKNIRA